MILNLTPNATGPKIKQYWIIYLVRIKKRYRRLYISKNTIHRVNRLK